MSKQGAIFGSKLVGEGDDESFIENDDKTTKSNSMIVFKSFITDDLWELKLPGNEGVEILAAGDTFSCVITSKLYLRFFTNFGGI